MESIQKAMNEVELVVALSQSQAKAIRYTYQQRQDAEKTREELLFSPHAPPCLFITQGEPGNEACASRKILKTDTDEVAVFVHIILIAANILAVWRHGIVPEDSIYTNQELVAKIILFTLRKVGDFL